MATGFSLAPSRPVRLALLCIVLQLLLNDCHAHTRWLFQENAGLDPGNVQGCGVGDQCIKGTQNPNKQCPENEECRICNEGDGVSGWCFCTGKYKRNGLGECIECPDPGFINANNECQCPDHYILSQNTEGELECTFCPPPAFVEDGQCKCPSGNDPEIIDDPDSQKCECKDGYKRIADGSCTYCPDPGYIDMDGECVCPDHYVLVQNAEGEVEGCTFCPPPAQVEDGQCKCPDGNDPEIIDDPDSQKCECKDGYKRIADGSCTYCPDPGYIDMDGECVCPDHYVIVQNAEGEVEGCTFCPPPAFVEDGQCKCPSGTSPNADGVCTCDIPDTSYVENAGCMCTQEYTELVAGVCNCIPNYEMDETTQECVPKECNECGECEDGYKRIADGSCTYCPDPGYIDANDQCQCPSGTSQNADGVCTCDIPDTSYVENAGCMCTQEYTELVAGVCNCIPNYEMDETTQECVPKECDECADDDGGNNCKLPFIPTQADKDTQNLYPGSTANTYDAANLQLWSADENNNGGYGPAPTEEKGQICGPGYQPMKKNGGEGVSCRCIPCNEGQVTYDELGVQAYSHNVGNVYKYYTAPDGNGDLIQPYQMYCHLPGTSPSS